MGLLDNNNVKVINPVGVFKETAPDENGIRVLFSNKDVDIKMHTYNGKELVAVLDEVVVWSRPSSNPASRSLYISTSGFGGTQTQVDFNSTNFPNLIEGSTIIHCALIPYTRIKTAGAEVIYDGRDWRLVVFTDKGQIYHNFPSRAVGYDGSVQDGDMVKFDESVVWDLPERKTPVKTTEGDDASLIATGCYRYIPCLPDAFYAMHPAISSDNGYGNGGFPSYLEYTDRGDGNAIKKRPRFFYPRINNGNAILFSWMSGYVQDKQVTMIGTYMPNGSPDNGVRMCVFGTSDGGRNWCVITEFGTNGTTIGKNENDTEVVVKAANTNFSEFGDATNNQLKFGSNTMSDGSAYSIIKRSQWTPTAYDKEPTDNFKYGTPVAVSSIVSSNDGIVVTTSSAHGLSNGDVILFKKEGGNASWDWLVATDYTVQDAGNGVIWKAKVLTSTTFKLMLEVHNPYNPLGIRHIHSINRCKDGYSVSCGEEYPNGWVMYIREMAADTHDYLDAAYKRPVYRVTSASTSIQRCLGVEILDTPEDTIFAGLDTAYVQREGLKPNGRTEELKRNSCGIFKTTLANVDDFSEAECIFQMSQPTYFFKIIQGVMIAIGQQNYLGVSLDYGKSWTTFQLPVYTSPVFMALAEWIGTTSKKEICIKRKTFASTLIICPKK